MHIGDLFDGFGQLSVSAVNVILDATIHVGVWLCSLGIISVDTFNTLARFGVYAHVMIGVLVLILLIIVFAVSVLYDDLAKTLILLIEDFKYHIGLRRKTWVMDTNRGKYHPVKISSQEYIFDSIEDAENAGAFNGIFERRYKFLSVFRRIFPLILGAFTLSMAISNTYVSTQERYEDIGRDNYGWCFAAFSNVDFSGQEAARMALPCVKAKSRELGNLGFVNRVKEATGGVDLSGNLVR